MQQVAGKCSNVSAERELEMGSSHIHKTINFEIEACKNP